MLATIEAMRYSREWTKNGGQYIPFPANWLEGKRWLDKPTEAVGEVEAMFHRTRTNFAYPDEERPGVPKAPAGRNGPGRPA
jgi:hypothetical protein